MQEPLKQLPFGSEFSPSQIDLAALLEIVEKHQGNRTEMEAAIRQAFFSKHARGNEQGQAILAMNCRLGLRAYGIISEEHLLTAFGKELALSEDDEQRHAALAKHILLHRNGMNLLQCVRDMNAAGQEITLETLREALGQRGIGFPSGGKHASMMRLWLAKAGVFAGGRWRIDEARVTELIGQKEGDFADLRGFTRVQRAFLRALASSLPCAPRPANEIARQASAAFGVRFPEKSLPKDVLTPLVEAGYITAEKTTAGRGAKPFLVAATPKLAAILAEPLLAQLETRADPKVVALLRRPIEDILQELPSADRHVAGLALEALAFKLMISLGLDYVATRLRGEATGGAEVDLVFESTRLVFSRWQVQCKNTDRVALDDVAKEVGLTTFLKTNVILVVTTGVIGGEARRFADRTMADSHLHIALLDGTALRRIATEPAHLLDALDSQARDARKLKLLEIARFE